MTERKSFGYAGKILRVRLDACTVSTELTEKYARRWLGGSGIGQWILYNEVKRGTTPYSPANRLIFGTGPLNGTLAPGATRLSADSMNAFTLGMASSSCDGQFAAELKFAGYDNIVIQGRARKPVYLWIRDDHVEIRDASHLCGKTTWETVDLIKQDLNDQDIQILGIGPAGENLVKGACIITNKMRAFGRCGLGGVMGSKNVKAIAVQGHGGVEIADPPRFLKAVDKSLKGFDNQRALNLMKMGTLGTVVSKQKQCGIPYKNFQYLQLPEEIFAKMNPERIQEKYKVRNLGYISCPNPCDRYYRIEDGPYAGLGTNGVQFEALAEFAGRLGVDDPAFFIKANAYCDQLGLDIDAVAGSIGWAMECFQRGILKESDCDGLKLEWGNGEVILELIRKIAYREGFGEILAEGGAHAAELTGRGSDHFALHMKGQDLYEVIRFSIGWGLGTAVSTRGGSHTTGAVTCEGMIADKDVETAKKVYGVTTFNQPLTYEGKAKMVGYYERLHRVNNALGLCHKCTSASYPTMQGFPEIAELYSAATGWETTEEDLRKAAERMLNVEKAFNLLHTNLSRKDDYPPPRCFEEPVPTGPIKGFKLDRDKWDKMLDEYYQINSWDMTTGFPTRKCLEVLDLEEIANDLEKGGKLGQG